MTKKVGKETMRIRLKAYESALLDQACQKIVLAAKKAGAEVSGPIPLPTKKEIVTVLRSPHKYKDAREQFELRTHKRVIDVIKPSSAVVDVLMAIDMPAGIEIDIKV